MDSSFDEIRSYRDKEIPAAMQRLVQSKYLPNMLSLLFPEHTLSELEIIFDSISTVDEFQKRLSLPASGELMRKYTSHVQFEGLEHITPNRNFMFLANHRDIVMDSCMLSALLLDHHFDTPEITFGSNLMQNQFLIDLGKSNKMFKIFRGGDPRHFYSCSMLVSRYMRDDIVNRHQSVWIAQRNGRTKDGNDHTNPSVLKMFAMSSTAPFVDNLAELNITPVTVSYEYEPCDFLKVKELYETSMHPYVKTPGEDLNSILTGIRQWKGNVGLVIGRPIDKEELLECDTFLHNDKFVKLAERCDQRIYHDYKLWKTNYIAYDLLKNEKLYQDNKYTQEDKESFTEYMRKGLEPIVQNNQAILQTIFLQLYSNPLINKRLESL